MVLFGVAFAWISTAAVDTSYSWVIVPQMVLMGLGMGLISTPATESILLVLPPARAGVGSAVNDATRELGGTLGVAVVGSVFSSVYAAHLATGAFVQLPSARLGQASSSINAAAVITRGHPDLARALDSAFLAGLHTSCLVVAAICLAGAFAAAIALPGRPSRLGRSTLAAGLVPVSGPPGGVADERGERRREEHGHHERRDEDAEGDREAHRGKQRVAAEHQ